MHDPLSGIQAFVYVAESENFSIAAAKLNLSRSAVAKIIARLEQRLNIQLFHRTTRNVSLTQEGELFYQHCKSALNEIETASYFLEKNQIKPKGKVKISVPHLLGRQTVMPIIIGYLKENPELEIQVSFSDQLVNLQEQGFDLAIRTGKLQDSFDLKSRQLGVQKMQLCCSPEFLASAKIDSIEDLKQYPLLPYGRGDWVLPWQLYENDKLINFAARGRIQLDDLPALIYAAKQGLGIAWLPTWLVKDELAKGELRPIFTASQGYEIDVHVVWANVKYLPSRVRFVLDVLVKELSSLIE